VVSETAPNLFESCGRLAGDPMDERIPKRLGAVQRNHEKKVEVTLLNRVESGLGGEIDWHWRSLVVNELGGTA
jgi:hypothetical protein